MEEQIGYVYMITSPTGRIYVGSTINIEQRWNNYKKYNCKDQPKIYNSLIKYKVENHIFEIVWQGSVLEMYKYETLIGWGFNVLEPNNLNLALPKYGDIYNCVSKETKDKIAKANKGKVVSENTKNKIRFSKQNISQTTKNKMSISAKNKIITDITKENMRIAQTGRKHSEKTKEKMGNWQIGKKLTQETKDKISKKHTGKKISKEHIEKAAKGYMKPILQYDLNDNFIKEWESAKTAGIELKIDSSSILKCCKDKLKTSKNFKWKYKL